MVPGVLCVREYVCLCVDRPGIETGWIESSCRQAQNRTTTSTSMMIPDVGVAVLHRMLTKGKHMHLTMFRCRQTPQLPGLHDRRPGLPDLQTTDFLRCFTPSSWVGVGRQVSLEERRKGHTHKFTFGITKNSATQKKTPPTTCTNTWGIDLHGGLIQISFRLNCNWMLMTYQPLNLSNST